MQVKIGVFLILSFCGFAVYGVQETDSLQLICQKQVIKSVLSKIELMRLLIICTNENKPITDITATKTDKNYRLIVSKQIDNSGCLFV